jgi:hypothetical protein
METYSILTFVGGMCVGLGMGMLLFALVVTVWGCYGDS